MTSDGGRKMSRRMRGSDYPYPARKVMIELLVTCHDIHWGGMVLSGDARGPLGH